jgi:putative membrane protein
MSASQPPKLFGTTNELAKERNRAAAERTLNSWIGICLSLIGIGVALDQTTQSLQQRFPGGDPATTQLTAQIIGLLLVGIGIGLLTIALMQHHLEIKTIERADYVLLSVSELNRFVVAAIVILGLISFLTILFLF